MKPGPIGADKPSDVHLLPFLDDAPLLLVPGADLSVQDGGGDIGFEAALQKTSKSCSLILVGEVISISRETAERPGLTYKIAVLCRTIHIWVVITTEEI